jgi:hypothetical protein
LEETMLAPNSEEQELPETSTPPEKLTRKQLGQLRRQYFTVIHGTVKACEHKAKFSKEKQPGNNCVGCWEAYFMTSVDLDFVHAVLTEKGVPELVKQKGKKFVKMFHGFLSSKLLPALAAETLVPTEPAKIEGGTFGNGSIGEEIQADSPAQQAIG